MKRKINLIKKIIKDFQGEGEYINVPKDTEHWFVLTAEKRIKALRYFTTTEGWTPVYTDRPIRFA